MEKIKVRLVTVGTEGAINLGFIARLVTNFDIDEFFVVSPRTSIEEALEYSARASDILLRASITNSLEEALKGVDLSFCSSAKTSSGDDVLRSPIMPWEMAEIALKKGGKIAIVVGRESTGLTRREIKLCDLLVNIPSSPNYRALNLSNATAILLYEIYKAEKRYIPRIEVDKKTLNLVKDYLKAIIFSVMNDRKREKAEITLKRVLAKSFLSKEEAGILLYILSKTCSKIEGCRDAMEAFINRKPRNRGYNNE